MFKHIAEDNQKDIVIVVKRSGWETHSSGYLLPSVYLVIKSVAGVLGFEPRNAGIKTLCLTTWRHPNNLWASFIIAIWAVFCSYLLFLSTDYLVYCRHFSKHSEKGCFYSMLYSESVIVSPSWSSSCEQSSKSLDQDGETMTEAVIFDPIPYDKDFEMSIVRRCWFCSGGERRHRFEIRRLNQSVVDATFAD